VLDLRLPGQSGLQLLEGLRSRHIDIPVIMISGHANVSTAVGSMKLGAVDFLEKPVQHDVLLDHVRAALAGAAARREKAGEARKIRACFAALTARERELVVALAKGKSSKMIAAEIGLSVKTVENHRSHLLEKTGAQNVAQLVTMAGVAGLL
jgi:two-component system, LuxR family, response regulator FixJ